MVEQAKKDGGQLDPNATKYLAKSAEESTKQPSSFSAKYGKPRPSILRPSTLDAAPDTIERPTERDQKYEPVDAPHKSLYGGNKTETDKISQPAMNVENHAQEKKE